ncbi:MAG TPA: hypothetical protein VFV23_05685 [Verrucomicrobiae bacterium]|nr:hypothetical protein [Verrucomicrobiae bacterium]
MGEVISGTVADSAAFSVFMPLARVTRGFTFDSAIGDGDLFFITTDPWAWVLAVPLKLQFEHRLRNVKF